MCVRVYECEHISAKMVYSAIMDKLHNVALWAGNNGSRCLESNWFQLWNYKIGLEILKAIVVKLEGAQQSFQNRFMQFGPNVYFFMIKWVKSLKKKMNW